VLGVDRVVRDRGGRRLGAVGLDRDEGGRGTVARGALDGE